MTDRLVTDRRNSRRVVSGPASSPMIDSIGDQGVNKVELDDLLTARWSMPSTSTRKSGGQFVAVLPRRSELADRSDASGLWLRRV